jgi:hypothetical protein
MDVLSQPQQQQPHKVPLQMLAAKALVGHSEPAAGLTGVVYAAQQLQQGLAAPLPHLRTLNPYVESAVEGCGAEGHLMMARSRSPLVAASTAESAVVGVSGFAFQGTNAHALIAAMSPSDSSKPGSSAEQPLMWQRSRVWVHMPSSIWAQRLVAAGGRFLLMECQLSSPSMAMLWDHRVKGRALVPGAGLLEVGASCAQLLSPRAALAGVAITSPCLLADPATAAGAAAQVALLCQVDLSTGQVQLHSSRGGAAAHQQQLHLTAQVVAAPDSVEQVAQHSEGGLISALQQVMPEVSSSNSNAGHPAAIAGIAADLGPWSTAESAAPSPAQVDAALQLSAVVRTVQQPTLADVLQVPSAVELYMLGSRCSQSVRQQLTAAVEVTPGTTAQAMVAHFRLCAPGAAAAEVLVIQGLQAKSMRALPAATEAAVAVDQAALQVGWQCASHGATVGMHHHA